MKIKVIDFGYKNLPRRAHENDAGADVYVCFRDKDSITLAPHQTAKIPLGLGVILPDGFAAYVFPRSGWASKGIVCELPPVDSGYRGEIHAICHNGSNEAVTINNGDRVGQLVVTPVVIAEFITGDIAERGENAFGSSGK